MFVIPFNPPLTVKNNLTGQQFTRLTVYSVYARHKGHTYWLCRCQCGNWKVLRESHLTTGFVQSCKCLLRERIQANFTTHGCTKNDIRTPEYRSYTHAKSRCVNITDKGYKDYGGRGIEFRFTSFEEFLEEINLRPTSRHSLDRIDNDGHYEKGNVRWATRQEQSLNRRTNHLISYQGRTLPLSQWAEIINIPYSVLSQRIRKLHWNVTDAMTRPIRKMSPRAKLI